LRPADDRYLEIKTLLGDTRARKRLTAEIDEFTVSFLLDSEMMSRIHEAARLFAADRWTTQDEDQLDKFLLPLFWSDVNPHLPQPITPARKT
jgi:hypothetical protein